jgi:hypothetical protein
MEQAMPDAEQTPSLRISNIVYGRKSVGNKVHYLIDPRGVDPEMAIPETVVLKRWRRRKFDGYTFGGTRLSSTFWRAVAMAFTADPTKVCGLDQQQIEQIIKSSSETRRQGFLVLPSAQSLHAIFSIVGPKRLRQLLIRHTSAERQGHSGVPDLFLFATNVATSTRSIARFVEVKKPEEPVRPDQCEEITFLNQVRLHARVLRLKERGSRRR